MRLGEGDGSRSKCSFTGWRMRKHWVNRSACAEFPPGGGSRVFVAGDRRRFQVQVVDGLALMSGADRARSLHDAS
eukprot:9474881-Pyramimonas_sp.AAC.1